MRIITNTLKPIVSNLAINILIRHIFILGLITSVSFLKSLNISFIANTYFLTVYHQTLICDTVKHLLFLSINNLIPIIVYTR